jgi:hypothetical protein
MTDPALVAIRRTLPGALALAAFAEFGFVVSIAATLGAFSGGEVTHTPPQAQAYFLVGLVVTVFVLLRTRSLIAAADRADVAALRRLASGTFVLVAYLFSAILPGMMLASARAAILGLE